MVDGVIEDVVRACGKGRVSFLCYFALEITQRCTLLASSVLIIEQMGILQRTTGVDVSRCDCEIYTCTAL
jgi:hypothetical protein